MWLVEYNLRKVRKCLIRFICVSRMFDSLRKNAKPTIKFIELAKEIRPFRFKLDANADFVNSCASLNRSLQCPSRFRSLCSISRWNLLSWPWWRLICSCGWTAKKPVPVAGGIIRSRWLWWKRIRSGRSRLPPPPPPLVHCDSLWNDRS